MAVNLLTGGDDMSTVQDCCAPGDIDQDCAELLAEDILTGHKAVLEDISANEEMAAGVARLSCSKKFDEVGPLEAAAAEVVLKKAS